MSTLVRRIFAPYRSTRIDWPSGWYFEWVLDWRLIGVGLDVSLGSESTEGWEYGVDLQLGPLYLDGGVCVRRKTREPVQYPPLDVWKLILRLAPKTRLSKLADALHEQNYCLDMRVPGSVSQLSERADGSEQKA